MSNLPSIDSEKVARDLAAKLADKEFELSSMKTLAEALLTERDTARQERDTAINQLNQRQGGDSSAA
jgi:hypothetical protein